MSDTTNDTRRPRRGQPVTLAGDPLDRDELAARLTTPGVVTGYADADGNDIVTTLDELADAGGGAA